MFNEIYFWMYFYLSKIKTNKDPAHNAFIIICVLQIFNLGTICAWINYFLSININNTTALYIGIILAVMLNILNHFLIYAKREIIFDKYKNMPQDRKKKGQISFWFYVVLTFVIFFVSVANL